MSELSVNALRKLLRSDDAKIRRRAVKELGNLGDPAAIPPLVRIYKDEEEDPKVRSEAEKAIRKYGRMMPWEGGFFSPAVAKNLATALAVSFAILLVLNVVVRVVGGGEDVPPTPTGPSDRTALITQYQTLYAQVRADYDAMAAEWGPAPPLACAATVINPQQILMSDVDRATFPDFVFVESLNFAIFKMQQVISSWNVACAGDKGTLEQVNQANDRLNSVLTDLTLVEPLLNQAINSPMATLPPPG